MSKKELSVSVVMCTYNGAQFVEEQLLSIVNQTYSLKEVLVFDDRSTDDTVSVIQKLAACFPIIRLKINEQNLGYTLNFQQAMLAAKGDAIAISDQDDVWLPAKIERLVKAWNYEYYPLIYCYSYLTEVMPEKVPATNPKVRRFQGTDARKLFIYNTVSGHAMLIRRSFLQTVLPLPENASYDWWMAIVACYHGGVQYLHEVLVYQRKHGNNATAFLDNQHSHKALHKRFKTVVGESNLVFAKAPGISGKHLQIALKLGNGLLESFKHPFYWPLFLHIVRYRNQLFSYKVRTIGFFSHIKHAYRLTKNLNS